MRKHETRKHETQQRETRKHETRKHETQQRETRKREAQQRETRKREAQQRETRKREARQKTGRARRGRRPPRPLPFAYRLAETLGEAVGTEGWRQLLRTATFCGEAALRLAAAETLRLLDAGGLPTTDGTRQRTPGGVLLRLVREAAPPDVAVRVFGRVRRVQVGQASPEFRARFARLVAAHQARGGSAGSGPSDQPGER